MHINKCTNCEKVPTKKSSYCSSCWSIQYRIVSLKTLKEKLPTLPNIITSNTFPDKIIIVVQTKKQYDYIIRGISGMGIMFELPKKKFESNNLNRGILKLYGGTNRCALRPVCGYENRYRVLASKVMFVDDKMVIKKEDIFIAEYTPYGKRETERKSPTKSNDEILYQEPDLLNDSVSTQEVSTQEVSTQEVTQPAYEWFPKYGTKVLAQKKIDDDREEMFFISIIPSSPGYICTKEAPIEREFLAHKCFSIAPIHNDDIIKALKIYEIIKNTSN